MKLSASVALGLVVVSLVSAQEPKAQPRPADTPKQAAPAPPPSLFPAGYLNHAALGEAIQTLARSNPNTVSAYSLGKSGLGRDLWLLALGAPAQGAPAKPSLLIVANLEADHLVGSHVALGLAERLAKGVGKDADVDSLLRTHTLYIVPRLNPDGAERLLSASPRGDVRTNLTAVDRDRDGSSGEDGPNDIDGDGLTLRMRAKDAKATLVPDAKDARILRPADGNKGEKAVYSEYNEGVDDDNDGQINEDPPGGVNLNRNWPRNWTDFDPEAGHGPVSEPEVRALITFAFQHPEIVATWSIGLNDNLAADAKGLDGNDAPYFTELAKLYRETTGQAAPKAETPKAATEATPKAAPAPETKGQRPPMTKGQGGGRRGGPGGGGPPPPAAPAAPPTSSTDATTDGAFSEWAYHQFGVVSLATRLWAGPGEGDAKWLEWNDKVMAGRAFVPFHEVDHPTLGKVAVGGWKPGVRLNPPAEELPGLADKHFTFLKAFAKKLPVLALDDLKVSSKGKNVYEVKITVRNDGYLPTATAQGVTTRQPGPILVKLNHGAAKLLSGKALNRINTLAGSGGKEEFRWLLLAPEAVKTLTLDVTHPKLGAIRREIALP